MRQDGEEEGTKGAGREDGQEEGVEEGELGGVEARRLGLKGCGGEDRGVGKDGQELEGGRKWEGGAEGAAGQGLSGLVLQLWPRG